MSGFVLVLIAGFQNVGAQEIDWTRYSLNAVLMWMNKFTPEQEEFVKQRQNWNERYPGSIQAEMMMRHERPGDGMELLAAIVKHRSAQLPASDRPQDNSVTVHLRLGDVLDSPRLNKETDVWHRGSTPLWHNNVYTKGTQDYFEAIINKLPPAVITAYIVGSFNHTMYSKTDPSWSNHTISIAYRRNVVDFFRRHNLEVVELFERTPDQDMIFMGTSKYFVTSGGSFTHNMARLCTKLGGKVIGPSTPRKRLQRPQLDTTLSLADA